MLTTFPGPHPRRRALVLGAALVAGLLLAEFLVRGLDLGPAPPIERSGGHVRKSGVPGLRLEPLPGGKTRLFIQASRDGARRVIWMHVNAQGFRGPEVSLEKPEGVLRVACLGDSHTFGYGVGEGEAWPAVLRAELGAGVEVLNCGVGGMDTAEELVFLRERVLAYEPDLVLLQYHVNDVFAHALELAPPRERGALERATDPRRAGWLRDARDASYLVDLVAQAIHDACGSTGYLEELTQLYREDTAQWTYVRQALLGLRDELAARDSRFAVVLFPMLIPEGEAFASHEALAAVQAFCQAERIPLLDLEPDLWALRDEELCISPRDWHANARAHRVAGETVAAWLGERGLR